MLKAAHLISSETLPTEISDKIVAVRKCAAEILHSQRKISAVNVELHSPKLSIEERQSRKDILQLRRSELYNKVTDLSNALNYFRLPDTWRFFDRKSRPILMPTWSSALPYELRLFTSFARHYDRGACLDIFEKFFEIEAKLASEYKIRSERHMDLSETQRRLKDISALITFCIHLVETGQVAGYEKHYNCLIRTIPLLAGRKTEIDGQMKTFCYFSQIHQEFYNHLEQKSLALLAGKVTSLSTASPYEGQLYIENTSQQVEGLPAAVTQELEFPLQCRS